VVVRAFIGMVIHHSLNNTLWDPKRSLLSISNQAAARSFANILLGGISNHQISEQATNDRGGVSGDHITESN
jgi:hypothetical protein